MNHTYPARSLEQRVHELIDAYRTYGHLAADLDPLGLAPRDWSNLTLEQFGLSDAELETLIYVPAASLSLRRSGS
jgi:2-oxoglutarate dehydrogenase E1 component